MGRLTLNILLSFAQFEREVIGERIRDKFAASRKKGMWMGGWAPLGYDIRDRKLLVNTAEAANVRFIFERFARIGSVTKLIPILAAEGIKAKSGKPVEKGYLYRIISNPVYVGEARHKGTCYPGEHQAIIDRALWQRVQDILKESPRKRAAHGRARTPALLKGLIFGPSGTAMTPSHTRRNGKLYRYYVDMDVLKRGTEPGPVSRIAAGDVESVVLDQLRAILRTPEIVVRTWRKARSKIDNITESEVRQALEQLDPLWDELFPAEQDRIIQLLVERVDVQEDAVEIQFRIDGLASLVEDFKGQEAA
jgi:site-specific DNA recombinase